MAVRLFVGNLPNGVTEAELRDHFSAVGQLSYVYIPTDRETGKQRGFAFIEFIDRAQADQAIQRLNNQSFKGRPLAVKEARAKEDRPRASGPSRPPLSRQAPPAKPMTSLPPLRDEGGHKFGPDAPPARSRNKTKSRPKTERAPKGPMREVIRGQFFSGDEDDDYDDDLIGENFASRIDDSEIEDDA